MLPCMGSYDGAEICELVGLFILNHLGKPFGKENIGYTEMTVWQSSKTSQHIWHTKLEKNFIKLSNNLT